MIFPDALPVEQTRTPSIPPRLQMKKIYAILTLALTLAAIPAVSAENKTDAVELTRQLGAPDFNTRENATKKLVEMGGGARNAVKAAMKSNDPEIRARAKRVWGKIQYRIFPGAGQDIADAISCALTVKEAISQIFWRPLVKKYAFDFIAVLSFLKEKKGADANVLGPACDAFLLEYPPKKIADFAAEHHDKGKILLDILSKRFLDDFTGDTTFLKLVRTLILANRPVDALDAASRAWSEFHDKRYLLIVARTAREPDVLAAALDKLQNKALKYTDSKYIQWELAFFAKLARETKQTDTLKTFLDNADIAVTEPRAAWDVARTLLSMKLYKETLDILSGLDDPLSLYLRASAMRESGNPEQAARAVTALLRALRDKENYYQIGSMMRSRKDPAEEMVWKKIISMPSAGSVFDSKAKIRLGEFYEESGKYDLAAKWYAKALESSNIDTALEDDNQKEENLKHRIKLLRRIAKADAEDWAAAIKARKDEKFDEALKKIDAFIAHDPELADAWSFRAETMLHLRKDFDEALNAANKAVDLAKNDKYSKREALIWRALILQEKSEFDKALADFEQATKLFADRIGIDSMAGTAAFYAGKYKKAAEFFQKTLDSNYENYAWIWLYIAKRKQGAKPFEAFRKYVESLEYNEEWPIPILKLYAGRLSKKQCLALAENPDPKRDNEMKCEAYYYIGELEMMDGNRDRAAELFKKCLECDILDFRETIAAKIRLKELAKNNATP